MDSVVIESVIPVIAENVIALPTLVETPFIDVHDIKPLAELEQDSTREKDAQFVTEESATQEEVLQSVSEDTAAIETILGDVGNEPELEEIAVGSRYDNYESLMEALDRYSEGRQVAYVTGQTKSVAYHNSRSRHQVPDSLRFVHMRLVCRHGGPARRTSLGLRPNQKSYKLDCPSALTVVADRKRGQLVVRSFLQEHNHALALAAIPAGRHRRSPRDGSRPSKSPSSRQPRRQKADDQPCTDKRKRRANTPAKVAIKHEKRSHPNEQLTSLEHHDDHDDRANQHDNDWQDSSDLAYERSIAGGDDDTEANPNDGLAGSDEGGEGGVDGAVGRVNSAWQCVYLLLEADHRALQARLNKLADENLRLSNALENVLGNAPGSAVCPRCNNLSRGSPKPRPRSKSEARQVPGPT